MPEDFVAEGATPELLRRYAALHTRAAELLRGLAGAMDVGDSWVCGEYLAKLDALGLRQRAGKGVVEEVIQ